MEYSAWYAGKQIGRSGSLEGARNFILNHPAYNPNMYSKKGLPLKHNPLKARFSLQDNISPRLYNIK